MEAPKVSHCDCVASLPLLKFVSVIVSITFGHCDCEVRPLQSRMSFLGGVTIAPIVLGIMKISFTNLSNKDYSQSIVEP